MSDIEPTTETIISGIKKSWSQSLDLRVSKVGNRMPETFMSSFQANQPPISDQWPELKCLMSLEWKKSTILQLQKDSSLITKRFCTVIETDNLKIGFLYLGSNTNFPRHAHSPEEIYHVVAGNCWRISGSIAGMKSVSSGDTWFHESEEEHGLKTIDEPVLIAWAWMGKLDGLYYFCDTPRENINCNYVST